MNKNRWTFTVMFLAVLFLACANETTETDSKTNDTKGSSEELSTEISQKLSTLKLPEGFKIDVFASGVKDARSMTLSPSGIVYVGTKRESNVYALVDTDKDGKADKKYSIGNGLKTPNGVAFRNGSLYVAEVNRLLRYDNIEKNLSSPPEPVVIYDDYPTDRSHGWKYIAFGPDGKLYVPVGAPCNICESKDEIYASITRMNADGSNREIYAKGIRNTVGFTWHPKTGNLWFTDNGRDMLGDNMPECELNKATKAGNHYGYPYCHAGDIGDPEFGAKFPCSDFVMPQWKLGPHVAPLGLKFYIGDKFPSEYSNNLIIARHGSWNRSRKSGYDVTMVKVENGRAVSEQVFVSGWLDKEKQEAWGRPVDVLVLPDGSVLISDDKADVIYRVTYEG